MNNFFTYLSILLVLIVVTMYGCNSGYKEKNGKIYHQWIHGGNWTRENTLIEEADAETFETIKSHINVDLGKDKNHVYRDAGVLEHADPNTFEQVKDYYWKDKNNVYFLGNGDTDCRIKGADPKTFKVIKDLHWAFDKNNVYFKLEKLNDANPEFFMALNEKWGKDKRCYYFENKRLDSLDYRTAEIVMTYFGQETPEPSDYIKDKNHVYFENRLVNGANPKTFTADGAGSFGHDDRFMFDLWQNEGPITEEYKKMYIDSEKK